MRCHKRMRWSVTLSPVPVTDCCPEPEPYFTSWLCSRILDTQKYVTIFQNELKIGSSQLKLNSNELNMKIKIKICLFFKIRLDFMFPKQYGNYLKEKVPVPYYPIQKSSVEDTNKKIRS